VFAHHAPFSDSLSQQPFDPHIQEEGIMSYPTRTKLYPAVLAVAMAMSLPALSLGQSEEEIRRKIIEDLKPIIEQEVQRRVSEALAQQQKQPGQPPATPASSAQGSSTGWSPADPITLARSGSGQAYINMSVIGDVVIGTSTTPDIEELLNQHHHDPHQRGFNLTGLELTLDGAVDPYFKGLATISLVLEPQGETVIELEEAWLQTVSLPANLQLRAGQIIADFGRQNPQHNHTWSFVDAPIVSTRMFGPDGLRNPGVRLSWLAPLPVYTELMLGVYNSNGGTAFSFRGGEGHEHSGAEEEGHGSPIHGGEPVDGGVHNLGDLLYVPRLQTSFDLTDTQTLLLGASAAFGPNDSGPDADTQIYGTDLYWKWRPVNAKNGFPFVSWQTEAMYRRYEAARREHDEDEILPAETLGDWGIYSQVLWGFTRGWVLGLRGEFATGDDAEYDSELRIDRTRVSPNVTWYPTEFSKIRLQYNLDHLQAIGDEHSIWMQFEFVLGAHAAHKF